MFCWTLTFAVVSSVAASCTPSETALTKSISENLENQCSSDIKYAISSQEFEDKFGHHTVACNPDFTPAVRSAIANGLFGLKDELIGADERDCSAYCLYDYKLKGASKRAYRWRPDDKCWNDLKNSHCKDASGGEKGNAIDAYNDLCAPATPTLPEPTWGTPVVQFSTAAMTGILANLGLSFLSASFVVDCYRMEFPTLYKVKFSKGKNPTKSVQDYIPDQNDQTALVCVPIYPAPLSALKNGVIASVAYHGTILNSSAVPSRAFFEPASYPLPADFAADTALPSIINVAVAGMVMIAPDGIGYGDTTVDGFYPYLIGDHYAISGFSALAAADKLLQANYGITLSKDAFSQGYSEGGFAALAIHKISSLDTFNADFSVVRSAVGAGSVDILDSGWCNFDAEANVTRPDYLAMQLQGYSKWHRKQFFNKDYKDEINEVTSGDMCTCTATEILNNATGGTGQGLVKTMEVQNLYAYCNGDKTLNEIGSKRYVSKLASETLVTGWTPTPQSVSLCHGLADEIVEPAHALKAKTVFGTGILTPTSPPNPAGFHLLPSSVCADHVACGTTCVTIQSLEIAGIASQRLAP